MNVPRYIYRKRRITKARALEIKQQNIEHAMDGVIAALEELKHAQSLEIKLTHMEYIEVKPGQPGYETADIELNPAAYQGNWIWR